MIVGGGCRGRLLATRLIADGHAVRISTRSEERRAAIEEAGAECWIGTPERLATLREALEGVSILCWLLGSAAGPPEQLRALHGSRLQFFLTQAIDTAVRGFLLEVAGTQAARPLLADAEETAGALAARNAIPLEFVRTDPGRTSAWLEDAAAGIASLLARPREPFGAGDRAAILGNQPKTDPDSQKEG